MQSPAGFSPVRGRKSGNQAAMGVELSDDVPPLAAFLITTVALCALVGFATGYFMAGCPRAILWGLRGTQIGVMADFVACCTSVFASAIVGSAKFYRVPEAIIASPWTPTTESRRELSPVFSKWKGRYRCLTVRYASGHEIYFDLQETYFDSISIDDDEASQKLVDERLSGSTLVHYGQFLFDQGVPQVYHTLEKGGRGVGGPLRGQANQPDRF